MYSQILQEKVRFEPRHEKTRFLPMRKQKRRSALQFVAFVFATHIVQFLYFLNPRFLASSLLLGLYRPVCVGPVQKPNCWFSHEMSHLSLQSNFKLFPPFFYFFPLDESCLNIFFFLTEFQTRRPMVLLTFCNILQGHHRVMIYKHMVVLRPRCYMPNLLKSIHQIRKRRFLKWFYHIWACQPS